MVTGGRYDGLKFLRYCLSFNVNNISSFDATCMEMWDVTFKRYICHVLLTCEAVWGLVKAEKQFSWFCMFCLFQLNALSGYEHRIIKWLLDLRLNRWRWGFAILSVRLEDMVFQTWVSFEKGKSAFDSKFVKIYLLRKQLSNCVCIFPIRVHRRQVIWAYCRLCVMLQWIRKGDYVVLGVFHSPEWVFDNWKLNWHW